MLYRISAEGLKRSTAWSYSLFEDVILKCAWKAENREKIVTVPRNLKPATIQFTLEHLQESAGGKLFLYRKSQEF